MQFSLDLNYYAINFAASARLIKPEMQKLYPVLTDRCIRCFTDAGLCGAKRCLRFCVGRSLSEGCLKCCEEYCNPTLRKCLGEAPENMPPCPVRVLCRSRHHYCACSLRGNTQRSRQCREGIRPGIRLSGNIQ
jgi:hypothetical protein